METLLPYQSCAYSWDEPFGERSLIVERLVGGIEDAERARAARGAITAGQQPGAGASSGFSSSIASVLRRSAAKNVTSTMVGVYGLDLIRPSAVVGNLRVGEFGDAPGASC